MVKIYNSRQTITPVYPQLGSGTPLYLSPELVEGRAYTESTDAWSTGVVLYELLTLRSPFDGSSLQQVTQAVLKGRYAPVPGFRSQGRRTSVLVLAFWWLGWVKWQITRTYWSFLFVSLLIKRLRNDIGDLSKVLRSYELILMRSDLILMRTTLGIIYDD